MNSPLWARVRSTLCLPVLFFATGAVSLPPAARGIEMFTYFGDGSRIGLPSLEVPIEAYPGSPLRSDRIRARNRAMQMRRRGMPVQPGQMQPASGVTIRSMPVLDQERLVPPVAPEPLP